MWNREFNKRKQSFKIIKILTQSNKTNKVFKQETRKINKPIKLKKSDDKYIQLNLFNY